MLIIRSDSSNMRFAINCLVLVKAIVRFAPICLVSSVFLKIEAWIFLVWSDLVSTTMVFNSIDYFDLWMREGLSSISWVQIQWRPDRRFIWIRHYISHMRSSVLLVLDGQPMKIDTPVPDSVLQLLQLVVERSRLRSSFGRLCIVVIRYFGSCLSQGTCYGPV